VQAEPAQPGEVDRGGQEVEVGGDLGQAADPYAAAAVAAADQVGQLALHLGPGRAVVSGASRVGLAGAGSGRHPAISRRADLLGQRHLLDVDLRRDCCLDLVKESVALRLLSS